MAFTLSQRSLRCLAGVHGDLDAFVRHLIVVTPIDFVVIEGLRSVQRQAELVASGASQTMNSRHITGHAVDLAAWVGSIRWDMNLYYQIADAAIGVCREHGYSIRWGGAWARLDLSKMSASDLTGKYAAECRSKGKRAFIDAPHFELPSTLYP